MWLNWPRVFFRVVFAIALTMPLRLSLFVGYQLLCGCLFYQCQRSFIDNVFTQQTAVSKREMKPQEISTRGTLYAQQHAASWTSCLQRSSWEQLSWRRAGSANQFAGTDAAGRQPRRGRGALTTVSK